MTLLDIGIAAGTVTAVITATYAVSKLPPVRWLWRNVVTRGWKAVVSTPLAAWLHDVVHPVVEEVVAPIRMDLASLHGQIEGQTASLGAQVESVHAEVRTLNEGTVGSFANEGETRRIEEIPHDERTATEQRHVDQAPPTETPQGPGR